MRLFRWYLQQMSRNWSEQWPHVGSICSCLTSLDVRQNQSTYLIIVTTEYIYIFYAKIVIAWCLNSPAVTTIRTQVHNCTYSFVNKIAVFGNYGIYCVFVKMAQFRSIKYKHIIMQYYFTGWFNNHAQCSSFIFCIVIFRGI